MTIRVAYDISVLGRSFQQPAEQSGVYRSIEELLYALSERTDVDITAMGVCGEDLLLDAIYSSLYIKDRRHRLKCEFDECFRSRFKLESLYRKFFGRTLSNHGDSIEKSLTSIYSRKFTGLLHRLHYTYGIDKISHIFDRNRYDVFHSPFLPLPSNDIVGHLPKILTIYDLIFINNPELGTPELCQLLKRVLKSIDIERDWIACISEFTRQELCAYTGMLPERVAVTPLAAAEWFHPVQDADKIASARQRYGIPEGNYFLTVATLQPRKNLNHLIRSFFNLVAEYPTLPANLVLVGAPSWEYEETFTAAKSSGAFRSRVIFTGHVSDHDLSAIYSGATAFVFPSIYEGFGLPPLEAMQCGTPVITSNTTALPEVVGDAGLLVDPKDSDELCQAMLTLIKDEELGQRLRQKGLERSKQFTWSNCAEKTISLYRKALAGQGQGDASFAR